MKIDFDSPIYEGDNVDLTCSYNKTGKSIFYLTWKRLNEANGANETLWIYYGSKDWDYANKAGEPYFTSKFEHTDQTFYDESHNIRLLDARKNDTGLYWCYIVFLPGYEVVTSPAKKLYVGESHEHARKCIYMQYVAD